MTWLAPVVTVPPESEPITVGEVRAHLRVSDNGEDALIYGLMQTARAHVERVTGQRLVTQTVTISRRRFENTMRLPLAPVQSISSITYRDTAGDEQTLSTDVYSFHANGLAPFISLKYGQSWPSVYDAPDAITVTAVAGHLTLPAEIGHAMLLLIEHWYDNAGPAVVGGISSAPRELPFAVSALLANQRLYAV